MPPTPKSAPKSSTPGSKKSTPRKAGDSGLGGAASTPKKPGTPKAAPLGGLGDPAAAAPAANAAPEASAAAAPSGTKEGVVSRVNLGELPGTAGPGAEEARSILLGAFPSFVSVFVVYCRVGSECATLADASKLKLDGFKKLLKDAPSLEVQGMGAEAMAALFARCLTGQPPPQPKAPPGAKGAPAAKGAAPAKAEGEAKAVPPEQVELQIHEFLSLMTRLAFLKANPRYGKKDPKGTAAPEIVPVPSCLKKFVAETLPKLPTGGAARFREMLQKDAGVQKVLQVNAEKLQAWHAKLVAAAADGGGGMYAQWCSELQANKCLEKNSIALQPAGSLTASLTPLQARIAFLDAHEAETIAFGAPTAPLSALTEAVAKCGDLKYTACDTMDFPARVRGMLQNVLGEATEEEVMTESVTAAAQNAASRPLDAIASDALNKKWLGCWRVMHFKDLVGWPLWETEIHDVLKANFGELQSMFIYYCGCSISGTGSIASATKIGLTEFLLFGKEAKIITKEFPDRFLSQQFSIVNSLEAMKANQPDRGKKVGGKRPPAPEPPKKKTAKPDDQLGLAEFINCLVRVSFSRLNPQWGSKYNKRELTPVPQCMEMMLNECVLPNAKRDQSAAFKAQLAADVDTQKVLGEYREKLQAWLRPILRKARTGDNANPKLSYAMWCDLMDGPDPSELAKNPKLAEKQSCPKQVGEWRCTQESEITGDERVNRKNQLHFKVALSLAQCRWNFLRSQSVDQLEVGDVDPAKSDAATLDFNEFQECIARTAVNKYSQLMEVYLPSHGRVAMTMADAVRAFIRNILCEDVEEVSVYEMTIIKADRFDWKKYSRCPTGMDPTQHKLFTQCWDKMPLMDVHGFPLWEKGVHDALLAHFPALTRIFSHYTKGISGIDSAADALEMELGEFHDFVKDAKLETKLINFTTMTTVFAKANAENTAEAYAMKIAGRRNKAVQAEMESEAPKGRGKLSSKAGAFPDLPDRFAPDYPEPGSRKNQKPDNRLVLHEFISCLVRISFLRANPKFGQYDDKGKVVGLPGCLESCLADVVIPNAKQDLSSLFRDEIAADQELQFVLNTFKPKIQDYFDEVTKLTDVSAARREGKPGRLSMEAWVDICKGNIAPKPKKGGGKKGWGVLKQAVLTQANGEQPLVGDYTVRRESQITGDERAKEKYSCRLTLLEAKFAFLNSQSLDQMTAGDAENDDAMATLDIDEFTECLCRCGRDKYNEVKPMSLADRVRGFIQNMIGEKGEEAVMRDATYIRADRYDWKLSKPLNGQKLTAHRKWLDCWQAMTLMDLHHFPLWEKEVHDVLQECFGDLTSIFAFYCKSIGGADTAEAATEMNLSEFRDLVRDVGLETKDLKFDVMCGLFIKANATNSAEAFEQKQAGRQTAEAKAEGPSAKAGAKAPKARKGLKDEEVDKALVMYEFVELLVRISFWRANPYHGIIKLAATLVPFPDCLHKMLHEVVLPNAQRDDSALFKEKLAESAEMQAVLEAYKPKLETWFNGQTQSMHLRGEERKLMYDQWQEILKKNKVVGIWECNRESEITGDDRAKEKLKCSLSMPQAKFAFLNSQSLDQMSSGNTSATSDMTTLSFDELIECCARCGVDKYKPVREMSEAAAIKGFCQNLLKEAGEEEVMISNTIVKAARYDWQRESKPLEGQQLAAHRKWLEAWQQIDIQDVHHFPLWEKEVHDVLQAHFTDLSMIFLAYCRSIGGSGSAEDAMEMEMAEFQDFVSECNLVTKEVNFGMMTNTFIKANATNTAEVREQRMQAKRDPNVKATEKKGKPPKKEEKEEEAPKKDQELVLFEFLAMLVRISFQRANPTLGNFGDKREVTPLPGCLERMLADFVLPNARRDNSAQFRDTVMKDAAVVEVLAEYKEKLEAWYKETAADDAKETDISDKLGMTQLLRVFDDKGLIGTWSVNQESEISGDPNCKTEFSWKLSIPQVKTAFMDSQPADQLGAGQASSTDDAARLDFPEFQEFVTRVGVEKYRPIKAMTPVDAVRAMMQNILGEKGEERAVVDATLIKADRYDANALAAPMPGQSPEELKAWLDVWNKMALMDMYGFPLWEKEVHDILQPLFKDISSIFLAYCRSISEVSAEDALEMSMEEFHDFVVDVGLETKKYKFDVMCNQFIKANASHLVEAAHAERKATGQVADDKEAKKRPKGHVETQKKDAELVLYEFFAMLVRISFWRCNPSFGLFGVKDEIIPVPAALSQVLTEVILPTAKRETSAQFRDTMMRDEGVLKALEAGREKLRKWYKETTANDAEEDVISDELGFTEWIRVCDRQDLVGQWEVEQQSEITGDASTQGTVTCRLSVPQAKAAFMDSQSGDKLGAGQAKADDGAATLSFEEFEECVARCGTAKYRAVKAMSPGQAVAGMIANILGDKTEEEVMNDGTFIRAERFDPSTAAPLPGQSEEVFKQWVAAWQRMDLEGLHGFPLWEKEVHDMLQAQFVLLNTAFKAYAKSLGDASEETAQSINLEEFHDFVTDVALETPQYKFKAMEEIFTRANASNKGAAGPKADAELMLHEFLAMIVRVAFFRLNPVYPGADEFTPVPNALRLTLNNCIVPNARTDTDPEEFRKKQWKDPEVQAALTESKERLNAWFSALPLDQAVSTDKLGVAQWTALLEQLNAVGSFDCVRGSDIVGDSRAGTEYKCRLSVPQAKAAFVNSQSGGATPEGDGALLDFEELLECVARCGVDKYRAVKELTPGQAVGGFIANLLGEKSEEEVIKAVTYIRAPRFDVATSKALSGQSPDEHDAWLKVWGGLGVNQLHGFPLWEKGVHDVLQPQFKELQSIFKAYACGTISSSANANNEMDMDEFNDFAVECQLPTPQYGFAVMATQFNKSDALSTNKVLDIGEFVELLIRISFYRANPTHPAMPEGVEVVELPGCLEAMLKQQVLPNARRDVAALFKQTTLTEADVQAALGEARAELATLHEKAKGGRPALQNAEFQKLLQKQMLFGEFSIAQHVSRLTQSQAKANFIASAADPVAGLSASEFEECVARCGVDKYKGVAPMPSGAAVRGFVQNLLGKANEEVVIKQYAVDHHL